MKVGTRKQYEVLVERAVEHVRATLDEALDMQGLGRQAGLSPLHFHRIFRGLLAETPGELHRRLRLERAGFQLATTSHAVLRIALDAGYDSHESFTRAFAAAFGLPPSDFRVRAAANPTAWSAASASALASPAGVHFTAKHGDVVQFTTEQAAMQVTVQTMPSKRVFAVAHRGPYNMIGAAFARLDSILSASTLDQELWLEMVALQYDDPESVRAADLRADAGIVVSEQVAAAPSGLHEVTIPAGIYARFVHQGPYDRLGDSWARFMGQWLVQSGRRVGAGPSYERYLNTPMNAAPEALLTELYLSVSERDA
jgi:AraC family transcriptional regulator